MTACLRAWHSLLILANESSGGNSPMAFKTSLGQLLAHCRRAVSSNTTRSMEKVEAFAACLLEANAPKVVQTLVDAKAKLADLSRVTNFHTFKLVVDGTRRVPGKPEWLRSGPSLCVAGEMAVAWDPEKWSSMHAEWRATLSSLQRWAEKIMTRAKALSYRPEDEEHWQEMEAMVFFRMHNTQGQAPVARASTSTSRDRQAQESRRKLAAKARILWPNGSASTKL